MPEQGSSLFRKKALERLSSPEQLDQLMQVVEPRAWLPLATLGVLVAIAVAWSIVGRIPITVTGQGVLVRPRKVLPLQSTEAGTLLTLDVQVGDVVKQGAVIGTINQSELRKQLQQERAKLAELQAQNQAASSLQNRRSELDMQAIQQQRQTLQQNLRDTQKLTPILKDKGLVALQRDRQNLQQRLQTLQTLLPTLKQRFEKRQRLAAEGAISDDVVLQTRQEYLNSQASLSEAESQLKQLDVKEADAERQYLENLSNITGLQARLQELDSRAASLDQQNLESSTTRQNQIQEVKRTIDRLELQLRGRSKLLSPYNGRILELTAASGQVLSEGFRLGAIDAENPSDKLVSVTYFTVSDGKQIKSGMSAQVTPTTVKREQFGGIVGTVTTVSPFPTTAEGAIALVGNAEIVKTLTSDGRQVEVFAALQQDPATDSGYAWSSSSGPPLTLSPGTTTSVRVRIGEQAPISYVIPMLRSMTGVY